MLNQNFSADQMLLDLDISTTDFEPILEELFHTKIIGIFGIWTMFDRYLDRYSPEPGVLVILFWSKTAISTLCFFQKPFTELSSVRIKKTHLYNSYGLAFAHLFDKILKNLTDFKITLIISM